VNGLACTICGHQSFAKLRIEITAGAATYLVCTSADCIAEASRRALGNLINAAGKLTDPHHGAIDVDGREAQMLDTVTDRDAR
jgi:hypothetical protein